MIAFMACLKPSSTERRMVLPSSSSSRIRSKISTFASTAMPIDNTIPASPGSVSVASTIERLPTVKRMYIRAQDRQNSAQAIVPDHDEDHEYRPHESRSDAVADRVAAETGTDLALFDDLERDG